MTQKRAVGGLAPLATALISALLVELVLAALILAAGLEVDRAHQVLALFSALLCSVLFRHTQPPASPGRQADDELWRLLRRWSTHCALVLLAAYLTGYLEHFSRRLLVAWFTLAPLPLLAFHMLVMPLALRHLLPVLSRPRSAVVVFANHTARELCRHLHASLTHQVLGFFDDRELDRVGGAVDDTPYLGPARDVADYVRRHEVEVVFIVLPGDGGKRAAKLFDELGDTTASVYFVPDFELFHQLDAKVGQVEGVLVLQIAETPFYGVDGLLKRCFDIAFSLTVLIGLAPLMALIALVVKLDSPGPALFKQVRYGLNGKPFHVYKFRSMVVEDRSRELVQVTRDDPRVTASGRFLRRTSLDELPQFLNVLRGDMSVVGPRPHSVAHNEYYRKAVKRYMLRHKVRPGLTGWAQVNGLRGETAQLARMEERIRCDLHYIRHWAMSLDLKIICMTVAMIFRDDNAH